MYSHVKVCLFMSSRTAARVSRSDRILLAIPMAYAAFECVVYRYSTSSVAPYIRQQCGVSDVCLLLQQLRVCTAATVYMPCTARLHSHCSMSLHACITTHTITQASCTPGAQHHNRCQPLKRQAFHVSQQSRMYAMLKLPHSVCVLL
jgi:hypothetical protein